MYKIISGKYETGSSEEQGGYQMLFGQENIQYKFDLYFHFYNVVHEFGHCIVDMQGIKMDKVEEEMYVNSLAVAYWRFVGCEDKIDELRTILVETIEKVPSPIPNGLSFKEFFQKIWGTEQLNNVMLYGFFQLKSVLIAMDTEKEFLDVLGEIGLKPADNVKESVISYDEKINADNAHKVIENVKSNFTAMELPVPDVTLELVDNPMVQCAQ